jgi:SMC interacting uncharacterized protein involved in chromosome segregation
MNRTRIYTGPLSAAQIALNDVERRIPETRKSIRTVEDKIRTYDEAVAANQQDILKKPRKASTFKSQIVEWTSDIESFKRLLQEEETQLVRLLERKVELQKAVEAERTALRAKRLAA